ncbi:MAG: arginine-tRNA-protein transferase [Saprospiraceae bacterium]|nr:arginine-tRNA-protein transferase [Saprospiraceae bacterium]
MEEIFYFFNKPSDIVQELRFENRVSLSEWDTLLALGWRHNGKMMFCTSHDIDDDGHLCTVLPLRYRLKEFELSKSQRKIFQKNQDLTHIVRPVKIDDEKHALFFKHIEKFRDRKPNSIWDFVSPEPRRPFQTWELCVFNADKKMVACSFFDLTTHSLSSTYAMYDLEEGKRSLGIFTMILEINFAIEKNKRFYYPGYVYDRNSFYDYKKKFAKTEYFDWSLKTWLPYKWSGQKQ